MRVSAFAEISQTKSRTNLTFALPGHFRRWSLKILFAFNGGTAETRQVKTLTLF